MNPRIPIIMISDLKLALRQLAKSPGFALTAIITLALGVGANAVVFSVLNSLVLKPLNLPGAENLYTVQRFTYASQSYPDYLDLRDRNRTFESMIAFQIIGPIGVDIGAHPSIAWPYMSSGNYFDALNVQPYLGRFFHSSDEKGENSAPYVVLSYAYWHSYFHGDPAVVGRPIAINKHPFTIIGVAPPAFRGTELFFAPDVWIPIVENPIFLGPEFLKNRGDHSPMVVGRLRPGVTPAAATADLNAIGAWLAKAYPAADDGVKFTLARPGLIGDMLAGPARVFMAGLMLLAGLILLAACANLGSLFAARASDRAKEVALRLASAPAAASSSANSSLRRCWSRSPAEHSALPVEFSSSACSAPGSPFQASPSTSPSTLTCELALSHSCSPSSADSSSAWFPSARS